MPVVPSALAMRWDQSQALRSPPTTQPKILAVNDVAVISVWARARLCRRNLTKFCQHRPQICLISVHGAGMGIPAVLRHRQPRLGTLHRDCRMGFKCFRNDPNRPSNAWPSAGVNAVIGIRVIPEERRVTYSLSVF